MANPLFELMGGNSPAGGNNSSLSQLVSMYKGMQNPQSLINSNPQLQSLLSLYHGDAKSAFYALCKQKGIDPSTILNMFK